MAWQNYKMKSVLQFDVFDLRGLVICSVDRDLFVMTHYWWFYSRK